ncbi:AraC family transcriptional regulator N-terminal domain-containing protein [Albimonas pacifica]|uniref:AraC family transcriptional regulator N-terminal domain-containing protein n=1 Tax=Albimonas pacifica TaxID=1114924 RepID=UPI003CCC371E
MPRTGGARVAMVQGAPPGDRLAAVCEPMVDLIPAGSRTTTAGERTLRHDPAAHLVMSIDLPAAGAVHASASGAPCRRRPPSARCSAGSASGCSAPGRC